MSTVRLRFYEELNDFLPAERRKVDFDHRFTGRPTVKDLVESLGVPHPEIDLILVNGQSVDFSYVVRDGDRISVYPMFETLDITPVTRLRPAPLREPRFVLDVHLGRLARYLRMLGFDTVYHNDAEDPELARVSRKEQRILLTRDVDLLKRSEVTHGAWIRSTDPLEQLKEALERFQLQGSVQAFGRCTQCNDHLEPVDKASIEHRLQPKTRRHYHEFWMCRGCGRVYWKGSHFQHMRRIIEEVVPNQGDRSESGSDNRREGDGQPDPEKS
jgi:uncharacterized protein with PIN domain